MVAVIPTLKATPPRSHLDEAGKPGPWAENGTSDELNTAAPHCTVFTTTCRKGSNVTRPTAPMASESGRLAACAIQPSAEPCEAREDLARERLARSTLLHLAEQTKSDPRCA